MVHLPHIGLLKAATIVFSLLAAMAYVMDPTVKVAIIAAIPPTISAFMWGWANHHKITTVDTRVGAVEVNTNSMLSQMKRERDAATTRADTAEAHAEGRKEGVASQHIEKETKED